MTVIGALSSFREPWRDESSQTRISSALDFLTTKPSFPGTNPANFLQPRFRGTGLPIETDSSLPRETMGLST